MTVPPVPVAGVVDEADTIAAVVLRCPGVLDLHPGGWRQVATYLPGRRVTGVQADSQRVLVSVVLVNGTPVPGAVAAIRGALAPLAGGRPVDVLVADIQAPPPLVPSPTLGSPSPPPPPDQVAPDVGH